MRVAVVAEFYPRAEDPVLGVWAHRQAVAARDAGADVEVFVLHRIVPAKADVAGGPRRAARSLGAKLLQPRRTELDGLPVTYVRYASPPRGMTYGSWGAWAAPALRRAVGRAGRFDLVHAHNAVPAGDAVRRGRAMAPLVVSIHGGDVFHTAQRSLNVARTFAAARLLLANSQGTAERAHRVGAAPDALEVVRLGTDVPPATAPRGDGPPTIVTVAHLVARKRHADVLRALAGLPGVRYAVIGDGPERAPLEALAASLGVADRVRFHGQLPHAEALAAARRGDAFVMPSTDEAFGVAYVEAMAAGLPAVGRAGEPGPEEIAALGGGMVLTAGDDLPSAIRRALDDRARLGAEARRTVLEHFTWERCGHATVAAYTRALGVSAGRAA